MPVYENEKLSCFLFSKKFLILSLNSSLSYLAFLTYKFFVFALSAVNNKNKIVPNKPENIIISWISSNNWLGIVFDIQN